MLSELQQRKINRLFDLHDTDHDGYLERTDFERLAQNFNALTANPPTPDQWSPFWLGVWDTARRFADTSRDERVSRAEWLAFMDQAFSTPESYNALVHSAVPPLFDAADLDQDGRLSAAEYRLIYRALAMDEAQADQVFPRLTAPGATHLSRADFAQRTNEYFGDDPTAPGNWLLGLY